MLTGRVRVSGVSGVGLGGGSPQGVEARRGQAQLRMPMRMRLSCLRAVAADEDPASAPRARRRSAPRGSDSEGRPNKTHRQVVLDVRPGPGTRPPDLRMALDRASLALLLASFLFSPAQDFTHYRITRIMKTSR